MIGDIIRLLGMLLSLRTRTDEIYAKYNSLRNDLSNRAFVWQAASQSQTTSFQLSNIFIRGILKAKCIFPLEE